MPIKARIDMLSTGIRTPVGINVIVTDLIEIDRIAKQIEQVLKAVSGTSSAYAERGIGGYYLDVTPDREGLVTASWSRTYWTSSRPRSAAKR